MIIINDKIIEEEVVAEHFLCNLNACKGACCWEGDYGAPLERHELLKLEEIYEKVKPYLTLEGQAVLETEGLFTYYPEAKEHGTPLMENAACAYMTWDKNGIAKCGIEAAYLDGVIDFKKPISCHLYPIRVKKRGVFELLQYDEWEICSAACELGRKESLPLYKFLKDALIRKYGEEFYKQLEAAAPAIEEIDFE